VVVRTWVVLLLYLDYIFFPFELKTKHANLLRVLKENLVAATQTTTNTAPAVKFSKSEASKKETLHKRRHHPIIDLMFSSWRKFAPHAFNYVIVTRNQLRPDLEFSP
jgi:hypothetical protein